MATELRLGDLIVDRYRLERPLGEGAFGAVWKARQEKLKRSVAVKFLKTQGVTDGADRRFEREAKVLARLDHPNCVILYDYGEYEEQPFLVTEYLEGETLHDWMRRDQELVDVLQVFWQLLDALAHAHALNIVHRDLKPGNVIIGEDLDGNILTKVLDFGISSMVGAKRGDITKTGELFGTPGYMSPEQLSGEEIGPESDLYAAGVILFRLVEGRAPFVAKTQIEAALKHLTHEAPRISKDVPEELKDIVAKLLQKDPADRYPAARSVQQALRSVPIARPDAPSAEAPAQPERPLPTPAHATPIPQPLPTPGGAPTSSPVPYSPRPAPAAPRPTPGFPGPMRSATAGENATLREAPPEEDEGLGWPVIGAGLAGVVIIVIGIIAGLGGNTQQEEPSRELIASALRSSPVKTNGAAAPVAPTRDVGIAAAMMDVGPDVGQRSTGCGGSKYQPGLQKLARLNGVFEETVAVYIPQGYDPNVAHPVVLMMHDTLQTPKLLLDQTDVRNLADRDRAIIVLPYDDSMLNAWQDRDSRKRARREFELAVSELCVDPEAVYLYGHGGGGGAVEKFACEIPGVRSLAVSAHRLVEGSRPCSHENISYLLLAPTDDGRDPVKGGAGCLGTNTMSLAGHETAYRHIHECGTERSVTFKHRGSVCYSWECKTPFESCHIDGGRPLPGGEPNINCEGRAADFPYGERFWNFFDLGSKQPTAQ